MKFSNVKLLVVLSLALFLLFVPVEIRSPISVDVLTAEAHEENWYCPWPANGPDGHSFHDGNGNHICINPVYFPYECWGNVWWANTDWGWTFNAGWYALMQYEWWHSEAALFIYWGYYTYADWEWWFFNVRWHPCAVAGY